MAVFATVSCNGTQYDIQFDPPSPPPAIPLQGEISITLDQSIVSDCFVQFDQPVLQGTQPLSAHTPVKLSRGQTIPKFYVTQPPSPPYTVNMKAGSDSIGPWCTPHPITVSR
ncbi:hypothetical protein ACPOL_2142 [Acidisarcina polymorpha]|uniref:Uncharacterized protein n=1 Tax=Acidisarcina polymorpha TaxID=2211140 RepID=A0A2Z5FYL8_9BACT|nr:hypothetical protein [Acidisarcina polymorpha]AXC11466.1 hypothetical protein ACPOL_2142 [Acidisarcina polymorpha]